MEEVTCIICGSSRQVPLFSKASRMGESFRLVRCPDCGLEYVSPRPCRDAIGKYYGKEYFTERTDRGYDNYFSENTRREIERIIALNLRDLRFEAFEKSIQGERRVLDIGCAAGYFLLYMKARGWDVTGVDIASTCVEFARGAGLRVYEDDYLDIVFSHQFHLITMWASVEHLHAPDRFIEKAHDELADGGMIYLSTCRAGRWNFKNLFGPSWRFYNFPEHLYFFSRSTMKKILEQKGFRVVCYATYGSGLGRPGSAVRKVADILAKRLRLGDMMIIAAEKI